MGLLYYLFSAHHWGLHDLRTLWAGETVWHDLIYALASYEANERAEHLKGLTDRPKVKIVKTRAKK